MSQGDNFISASQLYGGTYTMFDNILPEYGINAKKVDITDFKAVEESIDDKTRAIYCETITNPGLVVADITTLSEIAHANGIPQLLMPLLQHLQFKSLLISEQTLLSIH